MFPAPNSSQRAASSLLSSSTSSLTLRSSNQGRRKVKLAPGHSPLDWAALNSKLPKYQLRGVAMNTPPPAFVQVPVSELKLHHTRTDCWTCINGKVFNITPYVDFHPGGVDEIMKCAGRDGTALFKKYHSWVNPDRLLENCMVGVILKE